MNELDLVKKIDNGEELTEKEIRFFIWECGKEIAENEGDQGRWTQNIQSVIKIGERYFSTTWRRGLAECQENEFCYQPIEVIPKKKVIEIVEWIRVNKEESE